MSQSIEGIRFPSFKYGVYEIDGGILDRTLYKDSGSMEHPKTIALRSSPLADKVAFYTIGRDLALGLDQAQNLPDSVKEIALEVYQDCQKRSKRQAEWRAHFHNDAILIEPGTTIPGNPRPGSDYVAARIFQNVSAFTENGNDVLSAEREEMLWLPYGGGRFVLPTVGQNTRYGLPQETERDFNKVVLSWMDADLGLTLEQAREEVSKFYKNGDSGLFIVRSDADVGLVGPMSIDVRFGPSLRGLPSDGLIDRSGSFPLERSQ